MAAKRDNSPRRRAYLWVTWITKLLAGENKCWWAAWFKANHDYERTPDDPEREEFFRTYTAKHDALVNAHAAKLKAAGFVVKLEDDGAFKLSGTNADVAGKPDLVALADDGTATIVDGKSGKRRDSDKWQVLIYLFALPLTWLRGHVLKGQVLYVDGLVEVPDLDNARRERIVQAIKKVTDRDHAPDATPSRNECRFCDVAACTLRYKDEVAEGDATGYF